MIFSIDEIMVPRHVQQALAIDFQCKSLILLLLKNVNSIVILLHCKLFMCFSNNVNGIVDFRRRSFHSLIISKTEIIITQ